MRKYMKDNAENIKSRKPFKAETIKGEVANGIYTILSYQTPIATYVDGVWYLTHEKFSQTTTRQQSALRLILADEKIENLD